ERSHALAELCVLRQLDDTGGQLRSISLWNEVAGFAVNDDLPHGSLRRSYYGKSRSHCLEYYPRRPFGLHGNKCGDIRLQEELPLFQLVDPFYEFHVVMQTKSFNKIEAFVPVTLRIPFSGKSN